MFIHLGGDVTIPLSNIIGMFDIDSTTISQTTKDFLKTQQDEGFLVSVSEDIPKTFVLTDRVIYLSPISSATLQKRALSNSGFSI